MFCDSERSNLMEKQLKKQSGKNDSSIFFDVKESLVYLASMALIVILMFLLMRHNDKKV